MSIKNNKGITMISLVIVVVIMILLASITAYESNELISIARVQSVTTDLLLIQAKVRIINEKVIFENDKENTELYVGDKLSNNVEILNKLKNKGVLTQDETGEKYYILSQSHLASMGLDTLSEEDGYIVNYETEDVIYVKGVKNTEGKYLYKLSEMNP